MILEIKLVLTILIIINNFIEGIERLPEEKEEQLFESYLVRIINFCISKLTFFLLVSSKVKLLMLYTSFQEMFNITFEVYPRDSSTLVHDSLSSKSDAKNNFLHNFYSIEAHNKRYRNGNETFRQGINRYSHLSREEFVKYRTGLVKSSKGATNSSNQLPPPKLPKMARLSMPEHFNWYDRGIITPVRTQGLCGACYAFAALGAIEGQMGLRGNIAKLSEQEVIDCATHQIEYKRIFIGCKGGDDTAVYDFAKIQNGVTSEHEYPFQMRANKCNINRPRVRGSAVKNYVKLPANEEYIKEVLYLRGPLYASFHASDAFSQYLGGIFTDPRGDCHGEESNHAALLVGWGTDHGLDYWIFKNSYDTWWGEGGYFRIARGYNLCNIASDVSYPILD